MERINKVQKWPEKWRNPILIFEHYTKLKDHLIFITIIINLMVNLSVDYHLSSST